MAGTLAPAPWQITDANGDPVSGAKVNTYLAGTSTPTPTYNSSTLGTPNANPVVADAGGYVTMFLDALSYKFVVTDSEDNPLFTLDGVQAVHVGQSSVGDVFFFGGDASSPVEVTSYPSGATYDKCHAGSAWFNKNSGDLPGGTYKLEAMLMGAGGGTVTLALVNLTDGSPDTALVEISSSSTTGERQISGAITFAAAGAAKTYGLKAKVNSGAGFAWAARLTRTA